VQSVYGDSCMQQPATPMMPGFGARPAYAESYAGSDGTGGSGGPARGGGRGCNLGESSPRYGAIAEEEDAGDFSFPTTQRGGAGDGGMSAALEQYPLATPACPCPPAARCSAAAAAPA
jgi:hypothetical protein